MSLGLAMAFPQIDALHLGIGLYSRGRALFEYGPLVHDRYTFYNFQGNVQIVLDDYESNMFRQSVEHGNKIRALRR